MEASSPDSSITRDSLRTLLDDPETEIELCSFYEKLLKELYEQSSLKFLEIRQTLANIRSYKNLEIEEHNTVSFDLPADRLSYVFAYCLIHSATMYDRFSAMLKTNPSLLEKIACMKKMNLCFLGGGPGFEAVSLCKILSNVLSNLEAKRPPLQVHITVIDICSGWEEDAKLTLELAQENLLPSENVKIDFSFVAADLTAGFSEEVKEAIKTSHFVTMFKFLSDVGESSYKKSEIPDLVERIVECMKFKACLFYLDTSGGGLFKKIDCLLDGHPNTFRIYGPCLHNCHQLPLDSEETFHSSLKHIFRYLKCTNRITISCSAWVKVVSISKQTSTNLCNSAKPKPSTVPKEEELPKIKPKKVKIKKYIQSPAKLTSLGEVKRKELDRILL